MERCQRTTPHAHTPFNLLVARQRTRKANDSPGMRNEEDTLMPDPDVALAVVLLTSVRCRVSWYWCWCWYWYCIGGENGCGGRGSGGTLLTFHPPYERPQELFAARVQLGHALAFARHEVRRFPPQVDVRPIRVHICVRSSRGFSFSPREVLQQIVRTRRAGVYTRSWCHRQVPFC